MKAAYIERTGPPDVIQYGELPSPEPKTGEVLVRVGAVAVNPIDTYLRNGANYWHLPMPFIIGADMAGTVERLGPDATRFAVGDRVWCTNQGLRGVQGTFAEYAAIHQDWLYKTPTNVPDETAAACALVGVTAHLGLFREAGLKPGETIFVNGGTGGVGSMVLQMARALGAKVIATAGSDEKLLLAKKLGADVALNYHIADMSAEVKKFAPEGVNVYWETVREPNFDQILGILGQRGRIILMAGRDARPPFPVGPFYVKGCSMHGFVMFTATPVEMRVCGEQISHWLSEGKITSNIDRIMPLSQAAEAHRLQEAATLHKSGAVAGKIVLKP